MAWLYWRVKTRLPERFGQKCRILIRSRRMNSCLVEFEDGYTVVTSQNYVRVEPPKSRWDQGFLFPQERP